jgi:hypothetical protein
MKSLVLAILVTVIGPAAFASNGDLMKSDGHKRVRVVLNEGECSLAHLSNNPESTKGDRSYSSLPLENCSGLQVAEKIQELIGADCFKLAYNHPGTKLQYNCNCETSVGNKSFQTGFKECLDDFPIQYQDQILNIESTVQAGF